MMPLTRNMKSSSNARIGITLHLLERFPVYSSASSRACCDPTLHFVAVKQEASAAFQAVPSDALIPSSFHELICHCDCLAGHVASSKLNSFDILLIILS